MSVLPRGRLYGNICAKIKQLDIPQTVGMALWLKSAVRHWVLAKEISPEKRGIMELPISTLTSGLMSRPLELGVLRSAMNEAAGVKGFQLCSQS